jgi:hypothetical protein
MPWFFADSFDLYSSTLDLPLGHWDASSINMSNNATLANGRFAGSRAISVSSGGRLDKVSGANDPLHHFIVSWKQTSTMSGGSLGWYFTLLDGTTAQCSVVFRIDGNILLTSGAANGTILATYPGAFTTLDTWYAFEIEVFISNTGGYMNVRKNGNPTNDFSSPTNLDTQASANSYANKLQTGTFTVGVTQHIDDFIWRSDSAALPWWGDVRCYTRTPVSDVAAQWTPSNSVVPVNPLIAPAFTNNNLGVGSGKFFPFTAPTNGTIATVQMQCFAAGTANIKCALYNSNGVAPTTVVASANIVTNPGIGPVTWTFPSPPSVVQGEKYYIAFDADNASSAPSFSIASGGLAPWYLPLQNTMSYGAFPVNNPSTLGASNAWLITINITPTTPSNSAYVCELPQDILNTYLLSSTNGNADLYNISAIASTPAAVFAVVTRGLFQKSDAGTRNAAVQLKSGGVTVQSPSAALSSSAWGWLSRVDLTDPNTNAAWDAVAVNNIQIGPVVTA